MWVLYLNIIIISKWWPPNSEGRLIRWQEYMLFKFLLPNFWLAHHNDLLYTQLLLNGSLLVQSSCSHVNKSMNTRLAVCVVTIGINLIHWFYSVHKKKSLSIRVIYLELYLLGGEARSYLLVKFLCLSFFRIRIATPAILGNLSCMSSHLLENGTQSFQCCSTAPFACCNSFFSPFRSFWSCDVVITFQANVLTRQALL